MAGFTICSFKGKPAVQFHHDYGEFEFVLMEDPKDKDKIKFDSNVILTNKLYALIGDQALKRIVIFGKRFGYESTGDLNFEECVKILQQAKTYDPTRK